MAAKKQEKSKSTDTKAKKTTKKAPAKKKDEIPAVPSDDDATVGAFVEVVSGDHEGRYGVLVEAPSPEAVIVRTRDSASERIVTKYSDLRPAEAGRR